MAVKKIDKPKTTKTGKGRKKQLRTGVVLSLHHRAVLDGSTHEEFLSAVMRAGGLSRTKALARLTRLRHHLKVRHGRGLVHLQGDPRIPKDSARLAATFDKSLFKY